MENASKALLIAAAVLVVILLIVFGIKIYNSSSGSEVQAEVNMQTTEAILHNNKFSAYAGKNKTKAQAVALLNQVIANNSLGNNHTIYVSFVKGGTTDKAMTTSGQIAGVISGQTPGYTFNDKSSFTIEVGMDDKGYINLIRIY